MRLAAVTVYFVILRCLGVLISATLFVVIALTPAVTQQDDLNAILKHLNELYSAGDYPAALVEAQKLEAGAKARFGVNHVNYAVALYNLAMVFAKQGKYDEAEDLFKRVLSIREKALGASHPDVAATLNNIAAVNASQGKYDEAEGLYQRALAIREQALGEGHPDVAGRGFIGNALFWCRRTVGRKQG
jgi:tetratricopeptide (TPR) repeat protein